MRVRVEHPGAEQLRHEHRQQLTGQAVTVDEWVSGCVRERLAAKALLQRDIQDLVRGHLMTVAMREFPESQRLPVRPPAEDEPSEVRT